MRLLFGAVLVECSNRTRVQTRTQTRTVSTRTRTQHYGICREKLISLLCITASLVVLEAWPWPRGSSRTPHEGLGLGLGLDTSGLGLGLDTSGLGLSLDTSNLGLGLGLGLDTSGLGLGLERKVLALALARPRPRLFHTIQATWLLYVYALLKLTVSHDSLPFLV